jgi:carboxylesterase
MGPLLPGHGTTPQALNRCRWQDWATAIEQAYGELSGRCERVFVGGESMGAVLALYLASEHPEIVGVLTYAPALVAALSPLDRLKLRLAAPFVTELPKGQLDVPDRWQGYPGNPLKAAVQLMQLQTEVRKRLPRIEQPVLTVQGRLDQAVDHSGAEIIQREVRSSLKELHWMEHSTHVVILDRELAAVAEITLSFMEKALAR